MPQGSLLLIVDGSQPLDSAAAEAEAVLSHWTTPSKPQLQAVTVEQAIDEPALMDRAAAVWLLLQSWKRGELYELVARVQDRNVPTMLTRAGEEMKVGSAYQEGVVVCPPGTDQPVACAMLAALWSQVSSIQALRTELRMTQRHQGGLADQIGKIDEELRLAAQLQREFLPEKLPGTDAVQFRVLWRPAGYVSGDIYDVTRLDENHVGFFVADAIGHGVPAALMTMYIRRSLRMKVIDAKAQRGYRIVEPREALGKLNQDMIERRTGKVRFATACCGLINTKTLTVRVARAGHPFPMLLRGEGETQWIESDGGLLGVFPEETYSQDTLQLSPGDRLLIYSDGFELAFTDPSLPRDKRQKLANEQYVREFEMFRDGTPDEALRRLERKLDGSAGSLNQRDDLTVMCLAVDRNAAALLNPVAESAAA